MSVPQLQAADALLSELIRQSPFPLFLVRLSDACILEASPALETWAERDRTQLVGRPMLDFITDPAGARESVALLRNGVLDAYTRRAAYLHPDGRTQDFEVRFAAYVEQRPRTTAVALILSHDAELPPEQLEQPPIASERRVLGTVDAEGRIDRITMEATELLGYPPEQLIGRPTFEYVHPDDVSSLLLLAGHAASRPAGSCGRARFRTRDGAWLLCRVVLQPLAVKGPPSFAFSLSTLPRSAQSSHRVRELEEHLRRIAREIAASGAVAWSATMPTSRELPELGRLTAREYELVVRLFAGDRVPAIARSLFISESTVRNHLTSVYRKFGVHTQQDLLGRLRTSA